MREGVFSSEHCCNKNLHRDKGNKYSSIGRVFPYVHEVIVKIKKYQSSSNDVKTCNMIQTFSITGPYLSVS